MSEALIVGGGVAGASLAIRLARAGRAVVLIEKEQGAHHKVCGEFLSAEAIAPLRELGVDLHALGAVSVTKFRFSSAGKLFERDLPFEAVSLSRRVLDESLVSLAEKAGAQVCRGCRVDALEQNGQEWKARSTHAEIKSRSVFLATGKHDLRGFGRAWPGLDTYVCFKMYWKLLHDLPNAVELYFFSGGYAGLQHIEDGSANLSFVVRRSAFRAAGASWSRLLTQVQSECPHLQERLCSAVSVWPAPLAVSPVPYGWMLPPGQLHYWPIGDQAAVIPSFTGSGIAIALTSSRLAADAYLRGATPATYVRELRTRLRWPFTLATHSARFLLSHPGRCLTRRGRVLVPALMPVLARGTRIAS